MSCDRISRVLLGLIGAGVWWLALSQVGVSAAHPGGVAAAPEGIVPADELSSGAMASPNIAGGTISQDPGAPSSTYPMRWRVAWVAMQTGGYSTWCTTVVTVVNTTPDYVHVEVEWFTNSGTSKGLRPETVSGYRSKTWGTRKAADSYVSSIPWALNDSLVTTDYSGYAVISSDEPRIMASAHLVCRTGTSSPVDNTATIVSQTSIPVYPVGATIQYFQAATPMPVLVPRTDVPYSTQQ